MHGERRVLDSGRCRDRIRSHRNAVRARNNAACGLTCCASRRASPAATCRCRRPWRTNGHMTTSATTSARAPSLSRSLLQREPCGQRSRVTCTHHQGDVLPNSECSSARFQRRFVRTPAVRYIAPGALDGRIAAWATGTRPPVGADGVTFATVEFRRACFVRPIGPSRDHGGALRVTITTT